MDTNIFFNKAISYAIIGLVVLSLNACQSHQNNSAKSSSLPVKEQSQLAKPESSMCFQKVSGLQSKDTLGVSLTIAQEQVTGKMKNSIYEKDSRTGTLNGTIHGDKIIAVWKYMQEGTSDTLKVAFKLMGNQLLQYPLKFNEQLKREQTDLSSTRWISLEKINCAEVGGKQAIKISGGVTGIILGKDGYMATLKTKGNDRYLATISILRLQQGFKRFKIGDKLLVSGDTIHVGDKINILVNTIKKIK